MSVRPKLVIVLGLILCTIYWGWCGFAARAERVALSAQLEELVKARAELARQVATSPAPSVIPVVAKVETPKPAIVTAVAPRPRPEPVGAPVPQEPASRAMLFEISRERSALPDIRGLISARASTRLLLAWPDGHREWLGEGEGSRGWEVVHVDLHHAELVNARAYESLRWRATPAP